MGIVNDDMVDAAWQRLHANVARHRPEVALDGILVEKLYAPGTEVIVGCRRDPDWGPVVMVGLGGIWTEALQDVRLISADASAEEIIDEIRQLKAARLFDGMRGSPPLDLEAVAEVAATLGVLMIQHPMIEEIELNPLVVRARGAGATALDALIIAAEAKDR